jgi:ABC-2 type transport system ATP-binding protein
VSGDDMQVVDGPIDAFRAVGLRKMFGGFVAVDRVELTVGAGSFYGLVGPNGAGKTTMLSMAVGLLRPDEGRSQVFGVDVWTDPLRAKALMGVLPDGLAMPSSSPGVSCSRIWAAYEGSIRTP